MELEERRRRIALYESDRAAQEEEEIE